MPFPFHIGSTAFLHSDFDFDFLETDSREITRGFGCGNGAMSMVSTRESLRSHLEVGEMVVGRVKVDVRRYEMVPRSN